MKLYQDKRAPNPRRVRMFLAEKGLYPGTLPLELTDVDLAGGQNRSPEFLARNRFGLLPVLQLDDGRHIAESIAICRYFEAKYPEPALFGQEPWQIGQIEEWSRHAEFELLLPISMTFRHTHPYWADRIEQAPAWGEICKKAVLAGFDWLNQILATRQFVADEVFSVADITAVCAVDWGKVIGQRVTAEFPHLQRWHESMVARPSYTA